MSAATAGTAATNATANIPPAKAARMISPLRAQIRFEEANMSEWSLAVLFAQQATQIQSFVVRRSKSDEFR